MDIDNIDIDQFHSLKTFYDYVDQHALTLKTQHNLINLFVKYWDAVSDEINQEQLQSEIDCLCFDIKGGHVFSFSIAPGESNDDVNEYPSLNKFQEEKSSYIGLRAQVTQSKLLAAHYYHILWKSSPGIKDRKYALAAIPNYISSITEYYNLLASEKGQAHAIQIGLLFENLSCLCNEVNTKIEDLKELAKFLLFEAKELPFYCKNGIIEDMLYYPKIFKPADFESVLSIYENELKTERTRGDDHLQINSYLPQAIKVAQKVKEDVRKWYNEIGHANLRLAESEVAEERMWLKQQYYVSAIEAYGRAGNIASKKTTEQLYFELKPKVKLNSFQLSPDKETIKRLQIHQKEIIEDAKKVLKLTPDEIYTFIGHGTFFPTYSNVIEAAKNVSKNSFLNYVTTVQFDRNKNIIDPGDFSVEKKNFDRIYSTYIHQNTLTLLHNILIPGIRSGQLTFNNLILFLIQKTWIGKPSNYVDLGGDEIHNNWIALLIPSLVEYFVQIQAWTCSKHYIPSFVLCIDSLSLKFEGLLRDFCLRLNIGTAIGRQKGMQEVYIHNVLDNELFKEYFNEDDIQFFKYLFSNEGGMNLRNNVAHSYYNYNDYSNVKMMLLIAALLRIGKYNIEVTKN